MDMPFITPEGNQEWRENGRLHRGSDRPAVITPDGTMIFYQYGQIHRDLDMPAVKMANGDMYWFVAGILHRDPRCGPAIILADGTTKYVDKGCELDDVTHERTNRFWVYYDGWLRLLLDENQSN